MADCRDFGCLIRCQLNRAKKPSFRTISFGIFSYFSRIPGYLSSHVLFKKITTKKFIEIIGDWSPCFSHDAFQQCIFYYLESHDHFNSKQINRDITDHDIKFTGDTPENKDDDENYNRLHGQIKTWNILTSTKIQKEAFRRAMLIKANIVFANKIENFNIYETKNNICVKNKSSGVVVKYNYNINAIRLYFVNLFRTISYLNYGGAGFMESKNSLGFSIFWYLNFKYRILRGIKDFYNRRFSK